jgi:hypothetical protein
LTAAAWAPLDITAWYVELRLYNGTIAARLMIGAPILTFRTIPDSLKLFSIQGAGSDLLGRFDFPGPAFNHFYSVINDKFCFVIGHVFIDFISCKFILKLETG